MGGGEKIICEKTAKVKKKREEEDFSPFISRTIIIFLSHSIYRMCAHGVCDVCCQSGWLDICIGRSYLLSEPYTVCTVRTIQRIFTLCM